MTNRQSWILLTTTADREWKDALAIYAADVWDSIPSAVPRMKAARARYRAAIVDGFWRFVAPLVPGHVVPRSVAECLAEEWDERTRWPS